MKGAVWAIASNPRDFDLEAQAPCHRDEPSNLMLTKDLGIAPRANAGLGAPRAAFGASRGTRSPRASAGQNARRHGVTAQPFARSRPALERTPGALHTRVRVGHPGAAPVWHAQADSAACRPVSAESPGRSEGVRALRGARLWHRRAVSARHTHPPASSRAERLRLCEPHKSADRSQGPTSSSSWTSASISSTALGRVGWAQQAPRLPRSACCSGLPASDNFKVADERQEPLFAGCI